MAQCPTLASSHYLVDALCSMPNLTEVILHVNDLQGEFNSVLKAKVSTLQVCMYVCTLYPCHEFVMNSCTQVVV